MPDDYTECSKCHRIKWCVILPDEGGPICVKCLINISYGKEGQAILRMKGFIRNYHTFPKHNEEDRRDHSSYGGFIHSMDRDEDIPYPENIHHLLEGLPEGTVVEITVKASGRDDRAINDPIVWYDAHHYDILSRLPEEKQKEIKKLIEEARS